ncbi:MAG TPA: hypothetical protein VJX72_08425, partial [Candidatus Acidoferrum sp.]|nr:hypothetical protein [Candidatus Acidoferrum sp.]
MHRMLRCAMALCASLFLGHSAGAQNREAVNREARSILKELIEINTTDSVGNVTTAAEAMARRLLA